MCAQDREIKLVTVIMLKDSYWWMDEDIWSKLPVQLR
jgi:hypothetical protein